MYCSYSLFSDTEDVKPTSVNIQSIRDGASLVLAAENYPVSDQFSFTLITPVASVSGSASTYVVGSPALFFDQLAASWRGWEGPLRWSPLENEIKITATSDRLGHIELLVELSDQAYPPVWEFRYRLQLEAGSLENLAQRIKQVFPIHEGIEKG